MIGLQHVAAAVAIHLSDSTDNLPGVFGTLAPYISDYGYFAVALLVLLENFGIPMPGEATLVTAALFTVSGTLSLPIVILVGFTAAVVGDNLGYALGRYGGRPLVVRVGRRFGVTNELLDKVEIFFTNHGSKVVVSARFLPIMRHLNGISAGLSRMKWRRFLIANMTGAAIWVLVWTTVGVYAGGHIDAVNSVLEKGSRYVAAVLIILLVIWIAYRRFLRHRVKEELEEEAAEYIEQVEHEASDDVSHDLPDESSR